MKKALKTSSQSQSEPESVDPDKLAILKRQEQSELFYLSFSQNRNAKPIEIDYRKMTFLVVDDFPGIIKLHSKIIEKLGAKCIGAESGEAALEIFQASEVGSIDVILTDIHMHPLSGTDLSKHIRDMDREDAGKVVILAVTVDDNPEYVLQSGINGHLQKLIDPDLLHECLQKYLR